MPGEGPDTEINRDGGCADGWDAGLKAHAPKQTEWQMRGGVVCLGVIAFGYALNQLK